MGHGGDRDRDVRGLPSYTTLPISDELPPGSSWGVWGDEDVLGTLNLLTEERVRAAADLVRTGKVFSLSMELELPDPPLFGREKTQHTVLPSATGFSFNDRLSFNTQASTQWDGFRHFRHPRHGFYSGLAAERHGIEHWAKRGIVGRGVLADVGRWRQSAGRSIEPNRSDPIEPAELDACLRDEGVDTRPGDVLLLRTGWMSWYRALDSNARAQYVELRHPATGLRPGRETLRLLWDLHVAAIAGDNPGVEVWPPGCLLSREEADTFRKDPAARPDVFMHFSLIPLLGLAIGELFDLDELAEHCAREGVYEVLFVSAPLRVQGGVASPANALAIV